MVVGADDAVAVDGEDAVAELHAAVARRGAVTQQRAHVDARLSVWRVLKTQSTHVHSASSRQTPAKGEAETASKNRYNLLCFPKTCWRCLHKERKELETHQSVDQTKPQATLALLDFD